MNITSWRICNPRYTDTAFSGEGAEREGGRWNEVGTRAVYTAESQSLAILEILVHTDSYGQIKNHVLIPAIFDEIFVLSLDNKDIPTDWQADLVPPSTQQIGNAWLNSKKSAVLRVPSIIVPIEFNYLINPLHPDFKKIEIGEPESIKIDSRLIKNNKADE